MKAFSYGLAIYVIYKLCKFYKKYRIDYDANYHYKIAIHECGHAIIYYLMFGSRDINFISNKTDGYNNGVINTKDDFFKTLENLRKYSVFLYGGSVAEELIFGYVDIGSYYDKQKVVENLKIINEAKNKYRNEYEYDNMIRPCDIYDEAKTLIECNEDILVNMAKHLTKNRVLLSHHIKDIIDGKEVKITLWDKLNMLWYLNNYYFKNT